MLNFSSDPTLAEKQMRAVIFYLTAFGHIDGEFDATERSFVKNYIGTLVADRVKTGAAQLDAKVQAELTAKYTAHFHEVFEAIDVHVKELFSEAVTHDENQNKFVHATLKRRCFEIFQDFDRPSQERLMQTIDHLTMVDGEAHPAEVKFRAELAQLLNADLSIDVAAPARPTGTTIKATAVLDSGKKTHPFFGQFEYHYSSEPEKIQRQLAADREVVQQAAQLLAQRSAAGAGTLRGKHNMDDLRGGDEVVDGHIQVCPTKPGQRYELTVLGDLHGCYSCLKGAITQSRFLERVAAFKADPTSVPEPKLVLLGDYIDRGIFSLNGVLRSVLQIYCTVPDHVVVLRGNHEFFVEYQGTVYGGVKPSEAVDTLKPHVPIEVFRDYIHLFEALPNVFIFDRTFFVHAGIPRDRLMKERFNDLSSLEDPELRFQMLWSDPSCADVIPAALQEQTARFAFGRLQAQRFLQRLGCHTLIRGHEKVNEGFERVYDEPGLLLISLFSSGGADNNDLPMNSSYRQVTPMALTIVHQDGQSEITPWAIDYAPYNEAERNGFFQRPPELRFGG